ncbi:MAG TPA: S-layer homology domain-containing protein [Thermoanaerobaculia bacterium]
MERRSFWALLGFLAATSSMRGQILGTPASAPDATAVADAFGLGNQELDVTPAHFAPAHGEIWEISSFDFWASSITATLMAPLDLPAGAHISSISCTFNNTAPTGDGSVRIRKATFDFVAETPTVQTIGNISTSGGGGYVTVSQAFDVTIVRREGNLGHTYYLQASLEPEVRFRGCRVIWNRQVSVAPGTATFADVPVGHPYLRFVEALVASGITAGCGGGNYCVNAPITRGEMAVFLAAALGLHFPN